jgi:hypothetical protein
MPNLINLGHHVAILLVAVPQLAEKQTNDLFKWSTVQICPRLLFYDRVRLIK